MFEVLDFAPGQLPEDRPRYLMGVGKPDDILGAVERGVDMFDCVLPTRSGRTGQALTRRGAVNLRNARHADDPRPLDPDCSCPACSRYSRAYLHHVVRSGEIIAAMLLTWHNLHYYQELMAGIRSAIAEGRLAAYAAELPRPHAPRGDLDSALGAVRPRMPRYGRGFSAPGVGLPLPLGGPGPRRAGTGPSGPSGRCRYGSPCCGRAGAP
jgi:queuine tRNA-ribosyltransferase